MRDYEKLTSHDIEEFQAVFGDRRYEEMEKVITKHDAYHTLLHKGRMWGWSDTEVREAVLVAAEACFDDVSDWG